jgi:hypothetical protein
MGPIARLFLRFPDILDKISRSFSLIAVAGRFTAFFISGCMPE